MSKLGTTTRLLSFGSGLRRKINISFLLLFMVFLLFTSIMAGVKAKDPAVALEKVGQELINPIQQVNEQALLMQEEGFDGIIDAVFSYWGFFYNLYKIYLWIIVLMIPVNFIFSGTNAPMVRVGLAVAVFLTIQIFYSSIILGESLKYPFILIGEMFKNVYYVFSNPNFTIIKKPLEVNGTIANIENICLEGVCQI